MYNVVNHVRRYHFTDAGGAHPRVMECSMMSYYGCCVQLLAVYKHNHCIGLIFLSVIITLNTTDRPAKWVLIPLEVYIGIITNTRTPRSRSACICHQYHRYDLRNIALLCTINHILPAYLNSPKPIPNPKKICQLWKRTENKNKKRNDHFRTVSVSFFS